MRFFKEKNSFLKKYIQYILFLCVAGANILIPFQTAKAATGSTYSVTGEYSYTAGKQGPGGFTEWSVNDNETVVTNQKNQVLTPGGIVNPVIELAADRIRTANGTNYEIKQSNDSIYDKSITAQELFLSYQSGKYRGDDIHSGRTQIESVKINSFGTANNAKYGYAEYHDGVLVIWKQSDTNSNVYSIAQVLAQDPKDGNKLKLFEMRTDQGNNSGGVNNVKGTQEVRDTMKQFELRLGKTGLENAFFGDKTALDKQGYDNARVKMGTESGKKLRSCAYLKSLDSATQEKVLKAYTDQTVNDIQTTDPSIIEVYRKCGFVADTDPGRPNNDKGKGNYFDKEVADANGKAWSDAQQNRDKEIEAAKTAALVAQAVSNGECMGSFYLKIGNCIYQGLYYILKGLAWILGWFGSLFDFVISRTVVGLKGFLDQLGVIDAAWVTFRDLANIAFIFILLYLAISQILGLDEHGVKHTISKLIIFGLLLNFSAFFTKAIIDASNIVTLGFYENIVTKNTTGEKIGLGGAFMGIFQVQTLYVNGTKINIDAEQLNDVGGAVFAGSENPISTFIMGILIIITAMVFFVSAIWLFLGRVVIFIFLIMTSPLAFAGMILHFTEHEVQHLWWSNLLKNSFVAPVWMMMTWAVLNILNSEKYKQAIGLVGGFPPDIQQLQTPIYGGTFNFIANILNFSIAIGLLFGVMIIAEHIGSFGSKQAMGTFNKGFNKFAMGAVNMGYRNTVGAAAYGISEKIGWGKDKDGKKITLAKRLRSLQAGETKFTGKFNPLRLLNGTIQVAAGGLDSGLKGLRRKAFSVSAGHGGDHAGGHGEHGDEGSFEAEKYRKAEMMDAALYETKNSPKETADMMSKWMVQGGFNTTLAAQNKFESMDSKGQAEMLALIKDMQKEAEAVDPNSEKSKLYKTAYDSYRGRLSDDEERSVQKVEEGAMAFQRIKMDELINAVKEIAKNGGVGTPEHDAAKTKLDTFVKDLNVKQRVGLQTDDLLIDDQGRKGGEVGFDANKMMFKKYFDGQTMDKFEREQKLTDIQQKALGNIMSEQAGRAKMYEQMIAHNGSRTAQEFQMLCEEMAKLQDDEITQLVSAVQANPTPAGEQALLTKYRDKFYKKEDKMQKYQKNNGQKNYEISDRFRDIDATFA